MKRSTSFVCARVTTYEPLPQEEKAHIDYKQFIYVNTEQAHKEKHTIFHSPYKGGQKNHNFISPSFMSSDIFYPKDYSENNHSKSKPRVALIPTRNDIVHDQQYKSRMLRKSYSGACLNKSLNNITSKKVLEPLEKELNRSPARITSKILRKIQDSKQLRREIETLKKSPPQHLTSKENFLDQCPVYLQGKNTLMRNTIRKENSKRQLVEEMNRAVRRRQEEKQVRVLQKRDDKAIMDREAQRFYAGIKSSSEFERERARLLSELLIQQIHNRT